MPPVASRYAEAMIKLSVEQNALDTYQQELDTVSKIYQSEIKLREFLFDPKYDVRAKREVLTNLFTGRVQPHILHFLLLLLDKGRMSFLPDIYEEYARRAAKLRNTLNITIVMAFPLEPVHIECICEQFRTIYHSNSVQAIEKIESSLIGGVKVIVGDKLYDGTVKGKLSRLHSVLTARQSI